MSKVPDKDKKSKNFSWKNVFLLLLMLFFGRLLFSIISDLPRLFHNF